MLDVAEEQVHAPGDVIVRSGQEANGVCLILEGTARADYFVEGAPASRLAVANLAGPVKIYRVAPALDGEPYLAQLEAVTKTSTVYASRQAFLDELDHHPEVARQLSIQLAGVIRKTERWLIATL